MLHEFLSKHRVELISRCREKVGKRPGPRPTERELQYGIPLFLDQLIRMLRLEQASDQSEAGTVSFIISEINKARSDSNISMAASQHGNELLLKGFTVDQVVHDYGDLCQAVTEMAVEHKAAVAADEFLTLNKCLDNAIADAVIEFGRQRDQFISDDSNQAMNLRLGFLAHELRNLIGTAILSVAAIKKGDLGLAGKTGAVLDRSLIGLRDLVNRTLVEVRLMAGIPERRARVSVADFIDEIQVAATIDATDRGLEFFVAPVEDGLTVVADRQILAAAATNLLQNALKFTRPHGRVSLKAYSAMDRVLIEVEDECGGLPPGKDEEIFQPFKKLGADQPGFGLGLAISRRGIEANGGKLYIRNLPGSGCVFTIDLPRPAPP